MPKRQYVSEEIKTICLGSFPQGPKGEEQPIEWYYKDATDGTRTLISCKVLAIKDYSSVSNWLRKFAKYLPNDIDRKELRCPNVQELNEFFKIDDGLPYDGCASPNRQAAMTEYAKRSIPGWEYKIFTKTKSGDAAKAWWLSTRGPRGVKCIYSDGSFCTEGVHPMEECGVRPCLVIQNV